MADPKRTAIAFLPEAHTDFVFPAVREWRALPTVFGVAAIVALLIWLMVRREGAR